jgi:hypothetical protein
MNKTIIDKVKEIYDEVRNYDEIENTDKTFCNYFVAKVMAYFGYKKFQYNRDAIDYLKNFPMTANQMIQTMEEDLSNWLHLETSADAINEMILLNKVIIACERGLAHGHVCILLPGVGYSGKWKKYVPLCANIGKSNFWNKPVSYAFRNEPKYYLYKGI